MQEDLELAKRKHKKKHEDPACEHLRGFDVSSVVQWSTQPGTLLACQLAFTQREAIVRACN